MKKDKILIFLVIVFCFSIVNVATQLTINEGYIGTKLLSSGERVGTGHNDYPIETKLLPVAMTVLILAIVFVSLSDSEKSLVARFDKRLFGENKEKI